MKIKDGNVAIAFARIGDHRLGMRHWRVPIPGIFAVGACFAFPLFLYLREVHLEKAGPKESPVI
jgi:hypothetical protein